MLQIQEILILHFFTKIYIFNKNILFLHDEYLSNIPHYPKNDYFFKQIYSSNMIKLKNILT